MAAELYGHLSVLLVVPRLLVCVLLFALLAAPAAASFPGRNGTLAVTAPGCEEALHLRAIAPPRDLTPRCDTIAEDVVRDTFAPDWTADGARLLHVERAEAGLALASVGPDGGDRRVEGPLAGLEPSVSPDGTHVAVSEDGSLVVAALDGSDRRTLRARSCTPRTGCRRWQTPRWSPDGRWIAVQRLGWGSLDGLWLVDAASGKLVRRLAKGGAEADWSPDSKRLVFRSSYYHGETASASGGNLYVVRADGRGQPKRIVHREKIAETSPVWSPDGRFIAWVSLRFTAGDVSFRVIPSLWRVRATGGTPQRLQPLPEPWVDGGFFDAPQLSWQPLR